MPHRPIPSSRLEVETTTLATDRSSESWTKAIGRDGWLIGATIIMSAGSSTKRGALRTLGFLTGATGGPDDVRASLAGGNLYDGFAPAGYGALPVTATDQITLLTRNIQTGMRVRLILWIADENPGAIGWQQNVDPRTDGIVRSVDLGDPAAGADFANQTVPTDAAWRPRSWSGALVTAVGSSLIVQGTFTDGTVIVGGFRSSRAQGASATVNYYAGLGADPGAQTGALGNGDSHSINLPDLRLPEGYVIDWASQAIAAGDDWGDGQLLVEETIEP